MNTAMITENLTVFTKINVRYLATIFIFFGYTLKMEAVKCFVKLVVTTYTPVALCNIPE
jgi:hypothetical protein